MSSAHTPTEAELASFVEQFVVAVDFQTAVAQAEVEDRVRPGAYHNIEFGVQDSERSFVIATTRPERLAKRTRWREMPLGSAAMFSSGHTSSGRVHGRSRSAGSTLAAVMFKEPLIERA